MPPRWPGRLAGVAGKVTCWLPAAGKDVSEHLDAGRSLDDLRAVTVDELAGAPALPAAAKAEEGGDDEPATAALAPFPFDVLPKIMQEIAARLRGDGLPDGVVGPALLGWRAGRAAAAPA